MNLVETKNRCRKIFRLIAPFKQPKGITVGIVKFTVTVPTLAIHAICIPFEVKGKKAKVFKDDFYFHGRLGELTANYREKREKEDYNYTTPEFLKEHSTWTPTDEYSLQTRPAKDIPLDFQKMFKYDQLIVFGKFRISRAELKFDKDHIKKMDEWFEFVKANIPSWLKNADIFRYYAKHLSDPKNKSAYVLDLPAPMQEMVLAVKPPKFRTMLITKNLPSKTASLVPIKIAQRHLI